MTEEISTRSWGSRIKDAFVGIFAGILLIIGSFVLTFWNEGHGLHMAQSLVEAQRVLISVPNAPIDNKNNLRVIYFSGLATTNDILTDAFLNIRENAIGLTRTVEMYQWKEYTETKTESQMGGSEKQRKRIITKKSGRRNCLIARRLKIRLVIKILRQCLLNHNSNMRRQSLLEIFSYHQA